MKHFQTESQEHLGRKTVFKLLKVKREVHSWNCNRILMIANKLGKFGLLWLVLAENMKKTFETEHGMTLTESIFRSERHPCCIVRTVSK